MEIDQTHTDHQTKDTPVVGGMVEESNKARVAVADGSKFWGRDLLSDPCARSYVSRTRKVSSGCSES